MAGDDQRRDVVAAFRIPRPAREGLDEILKIKPAAEDLRDHLVAHRPSLASKRTSS